MSDRGESHEPGIAINVGGEGEWSDAIDINSLDAPIRDPSTWLRRGRFIQGDFTRLPVRSSCAIEVVGTRLPMLSDEDQASVVSEALRVLMPRGALRLHSTSGGATLWLSLLTRPGVTGATIEGGYARGVKA